MAALCGDIFISKLRKFRLSFAVFQYSYPSFPCISHCPLQIFSHLRKKLAGVRITVVFLFLFFLILLCIKGYPSSDSGPSKGNFMKRVQIQDDEEAQCQRWWRARKQEIAWASFVQVVFISRISIHTVRKGHFVTQDLTEAGATKWRAFF